MSSEEPLTAGVEEILRLFSGRRRSARVASNEPIACQGVTRRYRGQLVNVSRVGALVRLRNLAVPALGASGLLALAERVKKQFANGITIHFVQATIRLNAKLVRVAQHPTAAQFFLGCEFATPLTKKQCRQLGVEFEAEGSAS